MKIANEFIGELAEHISMPEVYKKIRQLIAQPDTDIDDFVEAINNDSVLSERMIRIANSSYFGFSRHVEDLHQAISLIGVMQFHDLILSSLCMRAFAAIPQQIFNLKDFWKYSVQCGIASRTIASLCEIIPNNHFFTLGLLHETGHALMFIKEPQISHQVIQKNSSKNKSIPKLEKKYFGFDYTSLSKGIMELWCLPEMYQQVMEYQLQPSKADKSWLQTTQVINLAHLFCQYPAHYRHEVLKDPDIMNNEQINLLPEGFDQIIGQEIDKNADSVLELLWPDGVQAFRSDIGNS